MKKAKLILENNEYEFPIIEGSEGEKGIDITSLRSLTGHITLDPGYGNTGSCLSNITFINGEEGILRYRGYPIEKLSASELFSDVSYLLIYGELDNDASNSITRDDFKNLIRKNANIHEDMKRFFDGFPLSAHPMAILSSMVTALSGFNPEPDGNDLNVIDQNIAKLLAKVKTIAAYSYRKSHGLPFIYPDSNLGYVDNFLHMMFSDSQ